MTFVAGTVLTAAALNTALASKTDLAMTQNAQTGTTYTIALADQTKLVTLSNASPVAVTLPLESSVAWPTGTQLRLLNQGAGLVTVAGAVGVTINGTPLTLAQYKAAVITKTGTNTWTFLPFSGGSAPAVISSTTGSPTITTVGNQTIYTFTGDGSITVGTAGQAKVCMVGGGGGGGKPYHGGGGGGGMVIESTRDLTVGTLTVSVGAAGAPVANGGKSVFFGDTAIGGGGGAGDSPTTASKSGASGGGGSGAEGNFGGASGYIQFAGGSGINDVTNGRFGGGGGGYGSIGQSATSSKGGDGGTGRTTTITGSSVSRGGGGGGCANSPGKTAGTGNGGGGNGGVNGIGVNGTALTGGGGGGSSGNTAGTNGGTGTVIIAVG